MVSYLKLPDEQLVCWYVPVKPNKAEMPPPTVEGGIVTTGGRGYTEVTLVTGEKRLVVSGSMTP